MTPIRYLLIATVLSGLGSVRPAAAQGNEVVVVYNTRVAESKDIADHYAAVRHVPAEQVIGLDVPEGETMARADFRNRLQLPLTRLLEMKQLITIHPVSPTTNAAPVNAVTGAKIRYLVLCYGLPLRIAEDADLREEGADTVQAEFRRNGAAVDSELACLPLLAGKMRLTGPVLNPLYGSTNAALFNAAHGLLLVARLDGPTPAIARALVDKAVQAESNGLWGRAYFDLRGLTNGAYKLGDDSLRVASEICEHTGIETVVDSNAATFPASFPLSQVAFYAGWYDGNASGPFARPSVEFMPGAFAYHLHSFSAATLRSTDRNWAGPLLARGATATMGCVDEPYIVGTPDMAVFFNCFVHLGFSYGEAAYSDQRFLSWQTTVVGDPLYRPFGRQLAVQVEALQTSHNPLIEWAWLRLVNLRLLGGEPLNTVANSLDDLPVAHQSPVLMEKLADLFARLGKPSSAVRALQSALKLAPSPLQRVRLELALAEQLPPLDRQPEAYEDYQQFLKDNPDYPDPAFIYVKLEDLAGKLGHKEDAAKYAQEITRLNAPAGTTNK